MVMPRPLRVGKDADWTQISAAGDQACGIRAGAIYCWGDNYFGQLGDGTTLDRSAPVRVGSESDWQAVAGEPPTSVRCDAVSCTAGVTMA
jgi:alpha-tubulin suppressor-like RCC1 family protein